MIDIDEVGTVGERITKLVAHFCQGNKAAFGRAADIQSGVLAGIVGGRESKPGFEILQKLLTAYPTVNPTWLLFGQGDMIIGEANQSAAPILPLIKDRLEEAAKEQIRVFISSSEFDKEYLEKLQWKLYHLQGRVSGVQIYTVADKSSSSQERPLLSTRLAISEKEAENLVVSRRINAIKISDIEGYRVSEEQVIQFVSNASRPSVTA